jgi:hypothetical protein
MSKRKDRSMDYTEQREYARAPLPAEADLLGLTVALKDSQLSEAHKQTALAAIAFAHRCRYFRVRTR